MTTILAIYHSQGGNTKRMAESVIKGIGSVDNVTANLNTCVQIERICKGFSFRKVYEPIISKGTISENVLQECFEMGQTIATGCDLEIY